VPLVVHFAACVDLMRCLFGARSVAKCVRDSILGSSGPILALILGVAYGGHFWLIGCAQCNRQEQFAGIGLRAMRSTRAIF
jgi:hypothetical protein